MSYVFGYGSLADLSERVDARYAHLREHRRVWGVAMDNSRRLSHYKYYLDPTTESAPDVFVVFLDLVWDRDWSVNGVLVAVDDDYIDVLDQRERNYTRVEVTSFVAEPVDGTVWAYVGSKEGRRRFANGMAAGKAFIHSQYLDDVEAGFAALGDDALAEFHSLTAGVPCPIRDLQRIDT